MSSRRTVPKGQSARSKARRARLKTSVARGRLRQEGRRRAADTCARRRTKTTRSESFSETSAAPSRDGCPGWRPRIWLLLAVVYLMYRESGDKQLLIVLAALLLF